MDRFTDIANAVMVITHAFKRNNMSPPVAVMLSNSEDAYAIIYSARQENDKFLIDPHKLNPSNIHEFDGKPCGMFELCGVKFYYPLKKIADKTGGFTYG